MALYSLKVVPSLQGAASIVVQVRRSSRSSFVVEKLGYFSCSAKNDVVYITINYRRLAFWISTGVSVSNFRLKKFLCDGRG